jgi:enterochelin esterase-like enzyme
VKLSNSLALLSVLLFCAPAAAQSPESPRIAALQNAVQQRSPNAVEAFWDEVRVAGAPLIERINERRGYSLVTFLWRGSEAQHVFVAGQLGQLTGTRRADNVLSRLGDTTVWFRSYWLPSDARTVYQIVVNAPLTGPEGVGSGEGFRSDPLNPKKWPRPAIVTDEAQNQDLSVLELPNAPPQPWLVRRPQVPAGQLQERTWNSRLLGNTRPIWVYTPPGYAPTGQRYALVVATDGAGYAFNRQAPLTLDNLIAAGRIPPVVVVFVANAANVPGKRPTRSVELTCNNAFAEFLATEIVPWARSTYSAGASPADTVIAGSSYGGLSAVCTALRRPDIFGNVLSQSGSFWWRPAGDPEGEWVIREYAQKPKANIRFYLTVGLLEIVSTPNGATNWLDDDDSNIPYGPSMVVVNRHMRDVLRLKGYPVTYAEVAGPHHAINWQGTFADGLIALLGSKQQSAR